MRSSSDKKTHFCREDVAFSSMRATAVVSRRCWRLLLSTTKSVAIGALLVHDDIISNFKVRARVMPNIMENPDAIAAAEEYLARMLRGLSPSEAKLVLVNLNCYHGVLKSGASRSRLHAEWGLRFFFLCRCCCLNASASEVIRHMNALIQADQWQRFKIGQRSLIQARQGVLQGVADADQDQPQQIAPDQNPQQPIAPDQDLQPLLVAPRKVTPTMVDATVVDPQQALLKQSKDFLSATLLTVGRQKQLLLNSLDKYYLELRDGVPRMLARLHLSMFFMFRCCCCCTMTANIKDVVYHTDVLIEAGEWSAYFTLHRNGAQLSSAGGDHHDGPARAGDEAAEGEEDLRAARLPM